MCMSPGILYDCNVSGSLPASDGGAGCQITIRGPAAPCVHPQSGHLAFLTKWQHSIQPKLKQLLVLLNSHPVAKGLALAQVFTYLPVLTEGKQLLKAEALCLLGTPLLQGFHAACCHHGVPLTTLGPMSKVWESGVVHVVQAAENLAADAHPLNRLSEGGLVNAVAEIIYLPIYDASPVSPAQGVVAAMELMIKPRTVDVMIVASVITAVGEAMDSLGLALSSTMQGMPSGRGLRADRSFDVNNGAWASPRTTSSFGGGLSRTASVRTLAVSHP